MAHRWKPGIGSLLLFVVLIIGQRISSIKYVIECLKPIYASFNKWAQVQANL